MRNEDYIGKIIKVIIDRTLGSTHPKYPHLYYLTNYGYVENTVSGDGEELDAYILGVHIPVNEYLGKCIAILRRKNDNDDKLIVVPENKNYTNDQIDALTEYMEQYFEHEIIR